MIHILDRASRKLWCVALGLLGAAMVIGCVR